MERLKNIAVILFFTLFMVSLCFNVHTIRHTEDAGVFQDTVRITITDTIPYYTPVPKDSTVIKYVTVKVPITDENVPNADESIPDSIDIYMPITQKVYSDSTYTAYISGYNPHLDSMLVFPRTQFITITETEKAKPKRWNVGVQAGYGLTIETVPKFTPYIGIGVSYNLFNL